MPGTVEKYTFFKAVLKYANFPQEDFSSFFPDSNGSVLEMTINDNKV